MMGSAPPAGPDGSAAVLSLLAVIADPEKAKAKLAELSNAQMSMEQATQAHNKALYELNEKMAGFSTESSRREAELSRRHSEVTDSHAKLIQEAAAHQDAVAKAKADLEKRERQLAMDIATLNQSRGDLGQDMRERESVVAAREAAVTRHENELNERHTILDDLHEEAMAMKAEAEKRFATLRALIEPDTSSKGK